jgi:hypothetical protein
MITFKISSSYVSLCACVHQTLYACIHEYMNTTKIHTQLSTHGCLQATQKRGKASAEAKRNDVV